MIDPKKHSSVAQFLRQQDTHHLFSYLKIDTVATEDEVKSALQARRRWAQGQQSNPKHRTEAVWIIKNISTLRALLIDNREEYQRSLESTRLKDARDALRPFILGAIADGVLSARSEQVLVERGVSLGLPEHDVQEELELHLLAQSARRVTSWPERQSSLGQQANPIAVGQGRVMTAKVQAQAAPPPSPPSGRQYLQFDSGSLSQTDTPQLQLSPPSAEVLTISRSSPTSITFTVHNAGSAFMKGKIVADRSWVTAHPSTLNPAAKSQLITLVIHPDKMPRLRGQTRVTIATRSGGNKSFIIQAQKRRSLIPLASLAGITIGALIYVANLMMMPPPAVIVSRLLINADPPTGEIYINNVLTSTTGLLETTSGFPIGKPFPIRVEASGFATWEQELTINGGQIQVVKPSLLLEDRMNTTPHPRANPGRLDEDKVNDAIQAQKTQFDLCFIQHVDAAPELVVKLEVRGVVNQLGEVSKLEFKERTIQSRALDNCLRRQFRALDLPMLNPRFDYAVFEYIFHYTVPRSKAHPNDP